MQHTGKITHKHDIVEVFSIEFTIQRMVAVGNTHQTGYPSDNDVEEFTTFFPRTAAFYKVCLSTDTRANLMAQCYRT